MQVRTTHLTTIIFFLLFSSLNAQVFDWNSDGYEDFSGGGTYLNIDDSGVDLTITGLVNDSGWTGPTLDWADEGMDDILNTGINDYGFNAQHTYTFKFSKKLSVYFIIDDINKGGGWLDELVFSGNPTFQGNDLVEIEGNTVSPVTSQDPFDGGVLRVTYSDIDSFSITHGRGQGFYSPGYISITEIVFLLETSTHEQSKNNAFNLYPNPTQDNLQIKGETEIDYINIFSTNGKLVRKEQIKSKSSELNLSALIPGVYYLQIHSANNYAIHYHL